MRSGAKNSNSTIESICAWCDFRSIRGGRYSNSTNENTCAWCDSRPMGGGRVYSNSTNESICAWCDSRPMGGRASVQKFDQWENLCVVRLQTNEVRASRAIWPIRAFVPYATLDQWGMGREQQFGQWEDWNSPVSDEHLSGFGDGHGRGLTEVRLVRARLEPGSKYLLILWWIRILKTKKIQMWGRSKWPGTEHECGSAVATWDHHHL